MNKFTFGLAVLAAGTFAFGAKAPKSAEKYYSDAAFQYIENRLPTAEITCKEGLEYYPDDTKLQMLADRIEESKNEQQKQTKENNSNSNENQDQNQNQDKNQDNQNQNSDQNRQDQNQDQNQEQRNSDENQSSDSGESSSSESNGSDAANNQDSGNSSSSQGENQGQNDQNDENDQNGEPDESPENPLPGQMSPQEASQLLKDFDEEHGERKPWKPAKGVARPDKDW